MSCYMVSSPPGDGKTRFVLEQIKKSIKGSRKTRTIFVIGPSQKISDIWIKAFDAVFEGNDLVKFHFKTINKVKRKLKVGKHFIYILDEFHRYLKHGYKFENLAKSNPVYLVSATPINPVNENSKDDDLEMENEQTEDLFETDLLECINSTKVFLEAITGKTADNGSLFSEILLELGIKSLKRNGNTKNVWSWPLPGNFPTIAHRYNWIDLNRLDQWSNEYAFLVHLISTDERGQEIIKKRISGCFTHPYKVLHVPTGNKKCPLKYIRNHPRFEMLIKYLEENKIMENGSLRKSILIFCCHQGVQQGLFKALSSLYPNEDIILAESKKDARRFNDTKSHSILVATDEFSESIDLHKNCKHLLHYEIPWSPLRLYQRIGRLTRRLHDSKFNKSIKIAHIVLPGSVEEERINRIMRRSAILNMHGLLPKASFAKQLKGLLGSGPSLHFEEFVDRKN